MFLGQRPSYDTLSLSDIVTFSIQGLTYTSRNTPKFPGCFYYFIQAIQCVHSVLRDSHRAPGSCGTVRTPTHLISTQLLTKLQDATLYHFLSNKILYDALEYMLSIYLTTILPNGPLENLLWHVLVSLHSRASDKDVSSCISTNIYSNTAKLIWRGYYWFIQIIYTSIRFYWCLVYLE